VYRRLERSHGGLGDHLGREHHDLARIVDDDVRRDHYRAHDQDHHPASHRRTRTRAAAGGLVDGEPGRNPYVFEVAVTEVTG
jgi:hypothetical protein